MSLDWRYRIAESCLQHSALAVKSRLTTGTCIETIMTNDSMPSSQASLRGPATFRITRVRFFCLLSCERYRAWRLSQGWERMPLGMNRYFERREGDFLVRLDA